MMSADREMLAGRRWRPSARQWLLLATGVLLIAAAFRLIALDEVPPGIAQDEVLDADIALFIRNGENALFFPYGYGHEPLYHYWAAPFQALFGDNILSIKLPAAFLGLLLVALTLRWAKRDYSHTAALVAGFGLAVSWWPIIFSRIGIRPILEPVLLVLAVLFWPLRERELNRRGMLYAALAGFWLGLSIYSYTAARIILLLPQLLLGVLAGQALWAKRTAGAGNFLASTVCAQMAYASTVLFVGLLLYLPLAITLRANPGLQQRLEQLEGPLSALQSGDIEPVLRMTAATLGVFSFTGDPRWTYGQPNRPLFDPLTSIFFYCGLMIALWRWRRPVYTLLPIWLLVSLLPSALSPDAPSTVRLVGALPVVYLLPGMTIDAMDTWLRSAGGLASSSRRKIGALVIGSLVLLLSINGYRTLRDGFLHWPAEFETRLRYQTTLRDIGRYWRVAGTGAPPVVADAFYEPIDRDSLRRSIGVDPTARWVQAGAGVAGAFVWPGGEGTPGTLYIPEYAPIDHALAEMAGVVSQPLFRSDGRPSFAVYALPEEPAVKLHQVGKLFVGESGSELISLAGVTQPENVGRQIQLATWWRIMDKLPEDIAIFIHLLDESGAIIAQYDGFDAAASTLRPNDAVLQRHLLMLPEVLKPGGYALQLGLYRRGDGQRVRLTDDRDSIEIAHCVAGGDESSGLVCDLTDFD